MKNPGKKVLGSAVLGAVVGAIGGLLLAPKSGKETRRDIAKKAKSLEQGAEDKVRDAATTAKKEGGKLVRKAKSAGRRAKDRLS